MTDLEISSKFNKQNILCVNVRNVSKKAIKDLKICFSLVYSIISLSNAKIIKNIARYYEVSQLQNKSILYPKKLWKFEIKLEKNKFNLYNISSGLQGIFCISNNKKILNIEIKSLKFYIYKNLNKYKSSSNQKIQIPIIPEPYYFKLDNQSQKFLKGFFIKEKKIKKIFNNVQSILGKNKYFYLNKKGFKICFFNIKCKKEEYKIMIKKELIEIYSSSQNGILYSLISLLQMLSLGKGILKQGIIHDYPRFLWRGMHLDCARQYYPVDKILKLLNFMALFKLNRFHWHLTDNEAWRLDIKCFPNLAKNLSLRGYNKKIPPTYGSGLGPTGGYYRRTDVNKILKHAKKLSIEIMPEVDIPAHSWALINHLKKLKEDSDLSWKSFKGNYSNNTLNPGLDFTWVFIEKVLKEISSIFNFSVIHIGVDERPKNSWTKSPAIKRLMTVKNLKNTEDVQDYFVKNVQKLLIKFNKRTAAWNEVITKSKKKKIGNKNILIFCWEDENKGIEVVNNNYQAIITPAQKCYFDMAYNKSNSETGLLWAGTIETKDIINWEPLKKFKQKTLKNVIGIQGNLWSETITNINLMDIMINPRLIALSEVAWSKVERRKWLDFKKVLSKIVFLTKLMGWKNHNF